MTSIGEWTFLRCYDLKNITIGNGVTSIGAGAFAECNDLTSATIPDSVTIIGEDTFYECNMLNNVTITANGGNAANVKQMMIDAGVYEYITWNMPR